MAAPTRSVRNSEKNRHRILIAAANLFLRQGYMATTLRELAKEAEINIGSLMHLFETKENILCELLSVMQVGQANMIAHLLKDKTDDKLYFWAAEAALQLYLVESSENLRDLYIAFYSLPKSSELIRRSSSKKMEDCFLPYNPEYAAKDFYEMNIAVSGIIRGFIAVPCDVYFTMENKISRLMEASFRLLRVPDEKAAEACRFVSQFDLARIAESVIKSLTAKNGVNTDE